MPLFFITGVAGAGKSTVCNELKARGYEAYDTDDTGFAVWRNKQTGYIHPRSSITSKDRTPEFLRTHSWIVPRPVVERLAGRAKNKAIYLCGVASNREEIQDLFNATYALMIDEPTMRRRLDSRTNNKWGKQPHEIDHSLEWLHVAPAEFQKFGYVIVDARQPLNKVVSQIIEPLT